MADQRGRRLTASIRRVRRSQNYDNPIILNEHKLKLFMIRNKPGKYLTYENLSAGSVVFKLSQI